MIKDLISSGYLFSAPCCCSYVCVIARNFCSSEQCRLWASCSLLQLSFSRCREMADEQLTQILNASTQWAVKSPEQSPPPHTTTATHTPQQTPPNTTTTSYNKDPQNTAQQQTKRRSITVNLKIIFYMVVLNGSGILNHWTIIFF